MKSTLWSTPGTTRPLPSNQAPCCVLPICSSSSTNRFSRDSSSPGSHFPAARQNLTIAPEGALRGSWSRPSLNLFSRMALLVLVVCRPRTTNRFDESRPIMSESRKCLVNASAVETRTPSPESTPWASLICCRLRTARWLKRVRAPKARTFRGPFY